MTPKQLTSRLRYWQRRLRLQDWRITVDYARQKAIDGALGRSRWNLTERTAVIEIADPIDIDEIDERMGTPDAEVTMLHELTHVKFAGFQPPEDCDQARKDAWESAIDDTAKALVGEEATAR